MGVGRFLWSRIAIPGTFNHVSQGKEENGSQRLKFNNREVCVSYLQPQEENLQV